MTIDRRPNGNSILTGPLVDQAALQGVLKRVRELGLPLLSVEHITAHPKTGEVAQ